MSEVIHQELSIATPDMFDPVDLNGGVFTGPRTYGEYDRATYLPKLERVCAALGRMGVANHDEIEQTMNFATRAYDLYEGKESLPHEAAHAFIIPTFVSSWQNGEYNSEITTSYPISEKVTSKTLVDAVIGVPPCVIESYPIDDEDRQSHILFAPILPDMAVDLGDKALPMAQKIISDTARFAKERLGATVVGLGAILPVMTELGNTVQVEGLTTTTGHGGTVHFIGETVERVIAEKGLHNNTIGVVGASGSIGRASLGALLEKYPKARFAVADTKFTDATGQLRTDKVEKFLQSYDGDDRQRIMIKPSAEEVFDEAKINVSAIVGSIDVANYKNLEDVVIIDDSQPGAFDRDDVEEKGGRVVWVVGQDDSKDGHLTKLGGFRYGHKGLMRAQDLFGCEAEAAAVRQHDISSAVRERVTPQIARRIGELFKLSDITVADQLQCDGRPVVL